MSVRIANIVPAGYREGFQPAAELIPDGIEVLPYEMDLPSLPTSALDLMITEVSSVETALRAQADGVDAVIINSVADYGIRAVRSALRIPVVGSGQTSMLLAAGLGNRFSIVSVLSPSLRQAHEAQLREYQLTDRCASIRFVTSEADMARIAEEDSWYVRMRARKQDMIAKIAAGVRAAVEEDGADVIVLGCTCMAPVAADLAELSPVPVINPLNAVYLQAELQLRLGITHSPRTYTPAATSRLASFTAMTTAAQPTLAAAADDCEACAVLDDEPAIEVGLTQGVPTLTGTR